MFAVDRTLVVSLSGKYIVQHQWRLVSNWLKDDEKGGSEVPCSLQIWAFD